MITPESQSSNLVFTKPFVWLFVNLDALMFSSTSYLGI